ncbi:hypothetical protein ABL78_6803 [Leptomonas seymouri]|uniref:Uncharacterized protein n=1 Tax=Leptomonas seymouri TaxID=5684 RepID=A0A0N0P3H3_LEPSE|nr:hypothetical protein ABL78_6803 [Leptomonas seymouri]|eukprot:KPI84129.1 hypothetical protein ABL78_6803 [Leptomonas seymouri]
MPSDYDTAGETFNNTYTNSTLVGNWLEDRLLRSAQQQQQGGGRNGKAAGDDGLLEDPRITHGRHAPQVRQELMRTTYDVDYNRNGGVKGDGTGMDDAERSVQVQQSALLIAAPVDRTAACIKTSGRYCVDRALLFSKDPVADPLAALPPSTNTDTYGAFYKCADAGDGSNGVEGGSAAASCAESRDNEHNLYESVENARTRLMTGSAESSVRAKGLSMASVRAQSVKSAVASSSARWNTIGFASLAAPAPGATQGEGVLGFTKASGNGASTRRDSQKRGCLNDNEEVDTDVRWCTSKQTADIPVEHCVFQRRLPPVRM